MSKHAVVRTDLMFGTDVRSGLVSVKYMGAAGETPAAIDNGNIVKLGALVDGEREVFVGKDVAAKDNLNDVVLIASVEVMYDEHKKNLNEFENEAGKICRGYHFHHADKFSVTKEALAGEAEPKVGDIVELAAGTKMNVAKAETGASEGATVVGKIIAVEAAGRDNFYVIQVD